MKQHQMIFMNMTQPGSCIYANRNEWGIEIVREPRESCIPKWTWRNQLRDMLPGTHATINGVDVYRKNLAHQASRYQIAGEWLDVTGAIAAIESGKQPQETGALRQLELPISVEERSA